MIQRTHQARLVLARRLSHASAGRARAQKRPTTRRSRPAQPAPAPATAECTGEKHGDLATWAQTCTGRLYLAGHSMGGAMSSLLAYWANHPSDPLGMGKTVTGLYTFSADPVSRTALTNGQRADGCFDGVSYYPRALAGLIPGYTAVADPNAMNQEKVGKKFVGPMIAWSSLDFKGSSAVASNRLGPGARQS